MHIFYTPNIQGSTYTLDEEESNHCNKVLRLKVGSIVHLIDGKGGLYSAQITESSKKAVNLSIINSQSNYGQRNHYLHIAIAPTKNIDRLEWFLEKATEIGVDEITPILCDRSERKVIKDERLEKVITAAMKQSLTAYHPKLNPLISFQQFVKQRFTSNKLIAHCMADMEKNSISQLNNGDKDFLILIGPEGDFSPNEIQLALQNEFKPVTLGNTRLRTETAGIAACFEVNYINRDGV